MRSYVNLAVLALATSTVSPALSAPIQYRDPQARDHPDTAADIFRRAELLRPADSDSPASSFRTPSSAGSHLFTDPGTSVSRPYTATDATSEPGIEPFVPGPAAGPPADEVAPPLVEVAPPLVEVTPPLVEVAPPLVEVARPAAAPSPAPVHKWSCWPCHSS